MKKKLKQKQSPRTPSSRSSGELELLRVRVATAGSLLKEAREQANQAKRRRKLAKLLAKRAREGAKQAKTNLAKARKALARAEAKHAGAGTHKVTTRTRKKPVRKAAGSEPGAVIQPIQDRTEPSPGESTSSPGERS